MKMDAGLVEHRREINGVVNGKVVKKKKVRRRSSSSSSTTTMKKELPFFTLQQLYSFCKNVFKGPGIVPPPQDVQNLCNILDCLVPEDFGLSRDLPFFKTESCVKGNPRVTYTTVYKCRDFSLVLFFLPASAVIPLHNHPEMTVFNKLLLGKMHIKAYDWDDSVDVDCSKKSSSRRLAKLKADSVFTSPCSTSVLYPTTGGNIHEFTALTPCAVLDVLGPPYSKEDGRDCTYYKEVMSASSDETLAEVKEGEQSFRWLEEIEMPENSEMDGIEYLGPKII
ncbi:plant cysteine oxidase 1-like [Chenopodium quinoa]|uniref:plant cysteine oxidase 1-like n=1 Tax=Chenopodium quinoa TaxID=63459 RepID=UPI000B78AA6A|nr:plant cysteine oxidase 1-like [Chenopodium quinoa]